jgi:hypothetical protein
VNTAHAQADLLAAIRRAEHEVREQFLAQLGHGVPQPAVLDDVRQQVVEVAVLFPERLLIHTVRTDGTLSCPRHVRRLCIVLFVCLFVCSAADFPSANGAALCHVGMVCGTLLN